MGNNLFVPKPNMGNIPMFNGEQFSYWKIRMSSFVKAIDEDLWSIIEDGQPNIPKRICESLYLQIGQGDLGYARYHAYWNGPNQRKKDESIDSSI